MGKMKEAPAFWRLFRGQWMVVLRVKWTSAQRIRALCWRCKAKAEYATTSHGCWRKNATSGRCGWMLTKALSSCLILWCSCFLQALFLFSSVVQNPSPHRKPLYLLKMQIPRPRVDTLIHLVQGLGGSIGARDLPFCLLLRWFWCTPWAEKHPPKSFASNLRIRTIFSSFSVCLPITV